MCISKVYIICNAYESGVGHGLQGDNLPNPYDPLSDEYEAYDIGYKEGLEMDKDD